MIDKGFEQYGSDSIAVIPMIGQLPSDSREQVGGEIWAIDPGQDQISGMIDDGVQIGFPLLGIPANVLIAGCGLPGGTESKSSHDLPVDGREIAQLSAG